MSDCFGIEHQDFERIMKSIENVPDYAEQRINDYLHGEGAKMLSESVTSYIPISTGRYAAHRNLRKLYKHQKTLQHARNAKWFELINGNLGISIKNTRNYYYLYFVQHGLGTSTASGGVDFGELGINNIYDKLINGLVASLTEEINNGL